MCSGINTAEIRIPAGDGAGLISIFARHAATRWPDSCTRMATAVASAARMSWELALTPDVVSAPQIVPTASTRAVGSQVLIAAGARRRNLNRVGAVPGP